MTAIGFRVKAPELYYVVVNGDIYAPDLIINSKIAPPLAYEFPDALAWYREQVSGLFQQHKVIVCGIKMGEPIARSMGSSAREGAIRRNNIEGVLMEVSSASGKKVLAGPFSTIGAHLDIDKPKLELNKSDFKGIQKWASLNEYYREAAMSAIAALGLKV